MASGIYNRFKYNIMAKIVNLEAGTPDQVKVMLLTNSHAFNADHNVKTDVSANDIGSKVVYVAGGSNLAGMDVVQGAGAGATKFVATNHAYGPGETLTAYHAVLWDDTVATDDLICSIDFGGAQTCTNGTFTIQWDAAGIITLT